MSQHFLKATLPDGRKVDVLMGWDRPCQELFATVFLEDDEDVIIWCSSYEHRKYSSDMPLLVEALSQQGIAIPAPVQKEVLKDREQDVGNRIVRW